MIFFAPFKDFTLKNVANKIYYVQYTLYYIYVYIYIHIYDNAALFESVCGCDMWLVLQ